MEHGQTFWGRPRDDVYGTYSHQIHNAPVRGHADGPSVHTQQPIVTGTSVIAVKFDKGIILAADNLASYGSLARFTDQERLLQVGKSTVVGVSGDISDLQHINTLLEGLQIEESYDSTGLTLKSKHIYNYLTRVMYSRRSKMDPLWNSVIVAGVDEDGPLLSYVDLQGTTYSAPALATGFGAHLAIPLLRKVVDVEEDAAKLNEQDARALIDECMKVLFYRDARSIDKYTVATITANNVKFDKDVRCKDMSWRFAAEITGYGTQRV